MIDIIAYTGSGVICAAIGWLLHAEFAKRDKK